MTSNLVDWLCQACRANKLALISHANPDGDTVGAALALRLAFLRLGKAVDVICDGEVPAYLRFLEGADAYIRPEQAAADYDAVIAVDVASHELMGKAAPVFDAAPVRMVIDHHPTNPCFGEYNLLYAGECACCVAAFDVIDAMQIELTKDIGTCLMTGMSTDTGHFQYAYTSPAAFMAGAKLLEAGVDVSDICRRLYRNQERYRVNLTRIAYQKMRFELDGQVGVIELTAEDFEKAGCKPNQTDGLVNLALEVEGVRMAILAAQRDNGVKLSLRAFEPDTVNDVAGRFGGGGHAQAAGCTIHAPIHEAVEMVLGVMKEKL
ncbi:MAG: DHH family phosphoesterase [Clostridia bacterium]|nr:DHH family phosphoesterase [Clostridia bacterium]